MSDRQIRFDDSAGYERYMGAWSRLAGQAFLDWLAPAPGWRWADIGCGSGAFSQLIAERCAPRELQGIDPSEAQLAFARARPATRAAHFQQGDAMALPFANDSFDAAVMALVIFYVPEPAKGIAEMVRVVRPGGLVAAYVWDVPGGGLPNEPVLTEMRGAGIPYPLPPSAAVSRIDALRNAWQSAGLAEVETREITVSRTFDDFDDFWGTNVLAPAISAALGAIAPDDIERLKRRVEAVLTPDANGHITCGGRANAVKGRVPA